MINVSTVTRIAWIITTFGVLTSAASSGRPRLNQIQVIGTHNSYHIAPSPAVMQLIALGNSGRAQSLDYTHRPLAQQFSQLGIRQIELDIYADPQGGLYAEPFATRLLPSEKPPTDPCGLLHQPGLKVFHIPDVDYRTTVLTFVQALQQVKSWSQAHPDHCPIMILVEVKDEAIGTQFTQPHSFGPADLDSIDAEIRSVFEPNQLLTPDDIRREEDTLRAAVLKQGWPYLDDVRGQVMFALDNGGQVRASYLQGHPSLQGRVLFASVDENHPAAAFMKINDAVGQFDRIQRMVKKGFLVRTRADAGTQQSRNNDTSTRDKALASGAQFVSTDYPEPDRRFSDYQVRFPQETVVRSNPISGNVHWQGIDLESSPIKKAR